MNLLFKPNQMNNETSHRRKWLVALLVLGGAATATWAFMSQPTDVAKADPNEVARLLRDDGDNLSEEQRQAGRERLGTLSEEEKAMLEPETERMVRRAERRQRMEEVVDGFFDTPLEERDNYLDEIIDEMQKRRQEREQERAQREADGGSDRDGRRPRGDGERAEQGERGEGGRGDGARRGRGGGGANGNSANQAKRAEFWAAVTKRADERGIELPRWRGRGQ